MRLHSKGFTLVELLIVIVIIGILASIAIPKFSNTKGRALRSNVKSDLRNIATAQESYLYDFSTYYAGAVPSGQLAFKPSTGVTITLTNVTAAGWAATGTHTGLPGITCALYVGASPPVAPAAAEGQITCN